MPLLPNMSKKITKCLLFLLLLYVIIQFPTAFAACGDRNWSCVGGANTYCTNSWDANYDTGSCANTGQINSNRIQCQSANPFICGTLKYYCWTVQCTCTPDSCPLPTNTPIQTNPGTFTVSGNVFVDTNGNKIKDGTETNYPQINISSTQGSVITAAGVYTINNIPEGPLTITLTQLPNGYSLEYPLNGPPPSYTVTVGNSCNTDSTTGSNCDGSGNILNLNFAITNVRPWFQTSGLDARMDDGYKSDIPSNPACNTGAVASFPSSSSTPGVIFTGNQTPSFGSGKASNANWLVGGTAYPEIYKPPNDSLFSAYPNLLSIMSKSGLPIIDIQTLPGCTVLSNCRLPNNLKSGIYKANDSVKISDIKINSNSNYIFLISGSLTIASPINVPNTSTAVFSTSDNIIIDRSVGTTPDCIAKNDIEGIFSADKNIVIDGINACPASDLQLRIGGTIIVNAGLKKGMFINNRNLCGQNSDYPAVIIKSRLDFILNLPDILRKKSLFYRELAP